MKRHKHKRGWIVKERLFRRFTESRKRKRCPVGLAQFIEHQSTGKIPDDPNAYFLRLEEGKRWFDYQHTEIRNAYFSNSMDWHGTMQVREDWKRFPSVLPFLLDWHSEFRL